jgi:hypothetical protein
MCQICDLINFPVFVDDKTISQRFHNSCEFFSNHLTGILAGKVLSEFGPRKFEKCKFVSWGFSRNIGKS